MKLTNEEIIREVERDIEAVIFNIKIQKDMEGEDFPDWRNGDKEHMTRAIALLGLLKEQLNSKEEA